MMLKTLRLILLLIWSGIGAYSLGHLLVGGYETGAFVVMSASIYAVVRITMTLVKNNQRASQGVRGNE